MATIKTVTPPREGLWRVARGENPYALRDPRRTLSPRREAEDAGTGHRFDSALGDFRVLYFSTLLKGEYGEALSPFRPDPLVQSSIGDEDDDDDEGLMPIGEVPADWRTRRVAVRVTFPENRPFVDAEAAGTRAVLTEELGRILDVVGLDEIDLAAVRSRDRRLTRWISQWVYQQQWEEGTPDYAGVRFTARIKKDWELWAVFDNVQIEEQDRRPILAPHQDPELKQIADCFSLTIF